MKTKSIASALSRRGRLYLFRALMMMCLAVVSAGTARVFAAAPDAVKVNGAALECPANSIFSQPPAEVTSVPGWSSEMDLLRAHDNFSGISGPIVGMVWWGGGTVAGEECVRNPDTFEVSFYLDSGGQPGAQVASQAFAPTAVVTDLDAGFGALRRYEVTFATPVNLSSGWVSVYGTGFSGCFFYWANGTGGNGFARVGGGIVNVDFAFCLLTTPETGCCGGCGEKDLKGDLRRWMGDYLLVSLTVLVLAALSLGKKRM